MKETKTFKKRDRRFVSILAGYYGSFQLAKVLFDQVSYPGFQLSSEYANRIIQSGNFDFVPARSFVPLFIGPNRTYSEIKNALVNNRVADFKLNGERIFLMEWDQ